MTDRKEGAMDDICLKCAMGKCQHVMLQTFRTNEGEYWESYYCALTGWELTDRPSSISRESCSRYMPYLLCLGSPPHIPEIKSYREG
jgi:hypothetical protein